MKFGKDNRFKNLLYSKGTIFLLLVLVVLLARSVWERYQIEREMAGRAEATQEELEVLAQRKEVLHEQVEYLEGERGIEEEIRKNFDVAKAGEQIVILMGENEPEEAITEEIIEQKKWYQFWK